MRRACRVPRWIGRPLVLALAVCALVACDAGYIAVQGRGQVALLLRARPVGEIVRRESDPERAWHWALAWSAREFARDRLQLAVTDQYERAIDLQRDAVAYVVSAAPAYDLAPYRWDFPLLGAVPYKGFFDENAARAEAARLAAAGLDVMVRGVSTYSLLGWLPDPLLSSVIDAPPERVVEVVIHELAHATVYAPGANEFDEGLATFIGRRGRLEFIADKLGPDSPALELARRLDDDADRYREAVLAQAQDLASYYATAAPTAAGKQRIFARHQRLYAESAFELNTAAYRAAKLPTNNAEVAALAVYTFNHRLYASAFAVVGHDWPAFIALLEQVAAADEPQVALRDRVQAALAQRAASLQAGL